MVSELVGEVFDDEIEGLVLTGETTDVRFEGSEAGFDVGDAVFDGGDAVGADGGHHWLLWVGQP